MGIPQEIHIENRVTYYQVIIMWGLLNTEYVGFEFASKKLARQYIMARFGKDNGMIVLS